MKNPTTISVTNEIADKLHNLKSRGETYNDVVARLIHFYSTTELEDPETGYIDAENVLWLIAKFVAEGQGDDISIKNELTDEYNSVNDLPESGYLRRYIEMLYVLTRPTGVELSDAPKLSFDMGEWRLVENEDNIITLQKRPPNSTFDEILVGNEEGEKGSNDD